jgi:hypothetical protein
LRPGDLNLLKSDPDQPQIDLPRDNAAKIARSLDFLRHCWLAADIGA